MRYLIVTVFVCVCLLAYSGMNISAQTAPFRLGTKVGLNLSSALASDVSASKFKPGYHAGVTVEYQLPKNFLIQSGLLFSVKGSKQDDLNASDYIGGKPHYTHTYNQLYLELPLYGVYKTNISNKTNIVWGGGPYFAYGIGGETKQKLHNSVWSDGITEIKWNTFGDGVFDKNRDWLRRESLNKFDFGAGIKADLEYYKYVFGIGMTFSIINIMQKREYTNLQYRNFNINISLGYKF